MKPYRVPVILQTPLPETREENQADLGTPLTRRRDKEHLAVNLNTSKTDDYLSKTMEYVC